jgi:GGDEF domain-containing protein
VEQDMHRLKEFSLAGTFALVCADKSPEQMELFEGELSSRPYLRLAEFLKAEQNPNITIGKIEGETFGIFFFGTESKEMFIWAERFKTKVAKQSATSSVGGNSFTVSIGVAPAENKSNFDELLQTARLALTKSQNAGGGKVTSST